MENGKRGEGGGGCGGRRKNPRGNIKGGRRGWKVKEEGLQGEDRMGRRSP